MNCPFGPEYNKLVDELGKIPALAAFHLNGGEAIPTIEQAKKLLDSKSLNILHHKETLEDAQGKNSGNTDIPLSEKGTKDASKTASTEEVKQLKTIYTSPLERAEETASILSEHSGAKIIPVEGLRSWSLGNFSGKGESEFPEKYYINRPELKVPGGESFSEFKDRVISTVQSLRNIGEDEAILTHSKAIQILSSLQKNYGDFSAKDYLESKNIEKGLFNIRQFNDESAVTQSISTGLTTASFQGFEPNFGLTQATKELTLTSKAEIPSTTPDKISKLEEDQKLIQLDDTINPETQQRRHKYYIVDSNGKKLYDIKESVTESLHKNLKSVEGQEELGLILAEKGTLNHKVFQDIITDFLLPDGSIGIGKTYSSEDIENPGVFWKIHAYVSELMDFYRDKGVKIIPECKVVKGRDLAGTIDLLAIYPDGSYDKYDWKFIKELSESRGVDKGRQEIFKQQSDRLASILKDTYGLSDRRRDFMIPIKVRGKEIVQDGKVTDFSISKIDIAPFDPSTLGDKEMYLAPVVIHFAEDDNTQIQKTLETLNNLYQAQIHNYKKMSGSEQVSTDVRIKRLKEAMFGLVFRKDLSSLSKYIMSELAYVPQAIEKAKEGDSSINLQRILERLNSIKEFAAQGLSEQYEKQINDPNMVSDDLQLLTERKKEFDAVLGKIGYAETMVKNAATDYAQTQSDISNLGDIRETEAELNFLEKNATASSQVQMKTMQISTQKIFQAAEDAFRNGHEKSMIFKEDKEAIKKSSPDPVKEYERYLLEKNKNGSLRLIHKFKPEFFEQRKAAVELDDAEQMQTWFISNTKFDQERYDKDLEKLVSNLQEMEKFNQISFEDMMELINEFKDSTDPTQDFSNIKALKNGDYANKYLIGNDKWFSDTYKELAKKPELLKLYDDIIKVNKELASHGLIEEREIHTKYPTVTTEMIEGMKQGEKMDFWNRWWHEVSVSHGDIQRKVDRNPLTDEDWKVLSMPYLHSDLPGHQSKDIPQVYSEVSKALEKYKALKGIENDMTNILIAEREKKVKPRDKHGNITEQAIKKDTNYNLLRDIIDIQMYGNKKGSTTTSNFANTLLGKLLKLDNKRELSTKKLLHEVVAYNSLVGLSFRPKSILSNLVGGQGNINLQGKSGIFFNSKQINKTHLLWASRDKNLLAALEYFNFRMQQHPDKLGFSDVALYGQKLGDQTVEDHIGGAMLQMYKLSPEGKIVNIRQEILNKTSEEDKTISPKELEKQINSESAKASLLSTMKLDSNKKPYWEIDGKKIDLNEIPQDKDGNPTDLMSPLTRMKRTVLQVTYKSIGNMNAEDRSGMHIFDLASAFTQYRSWIPGQIQSRWGKWNYESVPNTYTVGRWREFFANFFGKDGVGGFMKHQLALYSFFGGDLANPSLRGASDARYEKVKAELAQRGVEFNMSQEEFFHTQVGIAKSMARETLLTLGTLSLLTLVSYLAKKTNDPDQDARLAYTHKLLAKFYNEFSFYYSPTEFEQLFQNSLPVISLFKNTVNLLQQPLMEVYGKVTGDEKLQKRAKPLKAVSQVIPGVTSVEEIISLWDDDLRKYMGYGKINNGGSFQ